VARRGSPKIHLARFLLLVNPLTCDDGVDREAPGGGGKGDSSEWGTGTMVFKVGETVVYPHHGAALIEAIETRTIKGEGRKYLVLKGAQGDLTVRVPAENAEVVGVRDVVGQDGLDRVFEVLRAPHTEEPTNWSRRYKANLEKLASGDVNKVAEVVRDLWRREKDRGLSAGEKRMLAKARQILVSELALAEGTDEERAEILLDEVLATAS
jgi:CarD family transcriptional regulator